MSDSQQTTSHVLMVRPAAFGTNPDTAASNAFQRSVMADDAAGLQSSALDEFDCMVERLRAAGIHVIVAADTPSPAKPDAVFPNNWFSTHATGDVYLYPLEAKSRRPERRRDIIESLVTTHGFAIERVVDLAASELQGKYLESTGSLVLDRVNAIAYAARSTRTHPELVESFCDRIDYEALLFDATDRDGKAIYHTNVMMALGRQFAVVALEAIADISQRRRLADQLSASGHELISINADQLSAFVGNMLELKSADGSPVIALSTVAHDALGDAQRAALATHGRLLPLDVGTIERIGGGSVRCMLAEIFLPIAGRETGTTDDE